MTVDAGSRDIARASEALATLLPDRLEPLARLAYNYWWSWTPGGPDLFCDLDPESWRLCRQNPVRLLKDLAPAALEAAAADSALVERAERLAEGLDQQLAGPPRPAPVTPDSPAAFFCAEFAIHPSLPIYSGGLGVLAGDILKEASDRRLPMVAVGLMYRSGYFHQRVDRAGWQHEYWLESDPDLVPASIVTGDDGEPLTVAVPVWGREVPMRIWRANIGRVPLFLLDAELPSNSAIERWITARLYESSRAIRLAQYAALGIGGVRALRALGVEPALLHLNEGHAGLAILELARERMAEGQTFDKAVEDARHRVVFTTHTPVPAGNETYAAGELTEAYPDLASALGIENHQLLGLGRTNADDPTEQSGLTPLAIRLSRNTNGVSRRHGEVARRMWKPLFGVADADEVPIGHVTNGVHVATWMRGPMRRLLDRYLADGWMTRVDDPATWEGVDAIPDAELWQARQDQRAELIAYARDRTMSDRLRRGEGLEYVEAAAQNLDAGALTIGFARRLATYKRLRLVLLEPQRALNLLKGPNPVQLLFAGKAHPDDDAGKHLVSELFGFKTEPGVKSRVAFLEDYDLTMAPTLVAGCDVWINVPRPPLEASGTSGMKVAVNGGLNLSVLDGWWAEAYDGTNGWAISGEEDPDERGQDHRHAKALYDLLEHEVVPRFNERDADGVPTAWVAMMKASLRTIGPQFSAARMVGDYERTVYPR